MQITASKAKEPVWPFVFLGIVVILIASFVGWRINQADHFTYQNLTYVKVEPEREWISYDYVFLKSKNGQMVKYLCPSDVYNAMVIGTTYDIKIIDGAFSQPGTRIEKVAPHL